MMQNNIKMEGSDERIVHERKEKLKKILLKSDLLVIAMLVILVIFGVYIRSLPLSDHGGNPGLLDITTNDYTLGPDLDPWLFTRYAKEMINESFPKIDMMRNVPLGFDTSKEFQMVSYMIVLTYRLVNLFGSYSINYAAALMPVILFALTIIAFFLFVREIFIRKNESQLKANLIAVISTLLMIIIPIFLSRTVAGIPEKESVAFFFMFLTFFLFIKAWKTEKIRNSIILGILAGVSTGVMGLTWGGVTYIYTTISISCFLAFLLNKMHKKETVVLFSWLVFSFFMVLIFSSRFSFKGFLTSIDTGLALLALISSMLNLVIWNTKISQIKFLKESKIPKNLLLLLFLIIFGMIFISILAGPSVIIDKIKAIHQQTFKPITGRWNTTVAENRQPFFTEWASSFGPFLKGIPILFWLFFIGSIVLFKKIVNSLKRKDSWILTALLVLFLFGMIFSRYAPHPSILDGEGLLSQLFYYGSALLLIVAIMYYYIQYNRENNHGFEKIEFEYILLFSLFVLCLFTARSAIRFIMVLGPVAPIFASYLGVQSAYKFKEANDETKKIIYGILSIIIIVLLLFTIWNYYNQIKSEAYSFVPNYYTQQWQKAMSWVRTETPNDSVFAHWWDYGYWLQSIGDRATVTDGGNAIVWWNYLTGRYVLTGDNQKDALEFLYNHNATYFLIDSSDIGKYGAYSSIGSNKELDRFSWIPTMTYDSKQVQETKEGIIRIYQGASSIDEDIKYNKNGTQIFLPSQNAAIIAIISETKQNNSLVSLKQPRAIFYYQGKQIEIPLRYAYYNKQFFDFKSGLEGTAYIIPRVMQTGQGIQIDNQGALMYISPRVMRGMMAQVYLLNDPLNKFSNFKLVHSEPSIIVDSLNSQGAKLQDEFILFNDIQGPIKIWEIKYTGNEKANPEYLLKSPPDYIDWQF